jgi:hypothetical protein
MLVAVGLVSGCGIQTSYVPTATSPQGTVPRAIADVEVFLSTKPDRPYQEVGMLEVQAQSPLDGGASKLVNELRRAAANAGCDGVVISGSNDAVIGGTTGVATLKGYRGTCILFKDIKASEPPPRGAGGFTFDTPVAIAEAACTRASFKWSAGEAGRFTCGGVLADVGLNATSALRFCQDRLCGVELVAQPKGSTAAQWGDELHTLRTALVQKYGRPASEDGVDAPDCAVDPDRCATAGRMARTVRWKWTSGERIELALVVTQTLHGDTMRRSAEIVVFYGNDGPRQEAAPLKAGEGL